MLFIIEWLQAGIFWLELMNYYNAGWSLILIGIAESVIFAWVYGEPIYTLRLPSLSLAYCEGDTIWYDMVNDLHWKTGRNRNYRCAKPKKYQNRPHYFLV